MTASEARAPRPAAEGPDAAITLTVLGCRSGAPDAGSPCSGYVLTSGAGSILVDCGSGIAAALARSGLDEGLRGVVVTHVHADHSLDLVALAYGRRFPRPHAERLPLWLPDASLDRVDRLDDLFGIPTLPDLARPIAQSFDVRPLRLDGAHEIEVMPGLRMAAFPARHAVPSAALRFSCESGTIAFSSDTSWTEGVLQAADHADLFVCEATYLEATEQELEGHGHLTAELAGRLAAEASVRHLLLTHLSSWRDAEATLAVARSAAPGMAHISLARPGATWTVGA